MVKKHLEFRVNGENYCLDIFPLKTLRQVIREDLGLTGTKEGCSTGNCGACTVLLDGKAVKSCLVLAMQAQGRDVMTIEGLKSGNNLHPVQQAFLDHFAFQCGYCTPGMILTAKSILDENPSISEDEIREALHGNLCRCTGYTKIISAIKAVQGNLPVQGGRGN